MTEETLTERFEASRPRLHAVATRMLGSSAEADDVVQETWLRATRAGTDGVDNVEGWLTTITSRLVPRRAAVAHSPLDTSRIGRTTPGVRAQPRGGRAGG